MKSKEDLARFLSEAGISADFLTWSGLFLSFGSAALVGFGLFFAAGAALLLSGLCDLLDGAVARASGKADAAGGILDSTLDRYGDGAVLGALVLRAAYFQDLRTAALALAALIGSFAISYVRARAECEVESCRVGFWERGERLVYLSLGLLFNNLFVVLAVMAVGVQWTAWQRLSYARLLARGGGRVPDNAKPYRGRNSALYAFKAGTLVVVALFFRL